MAKENEGYLKPKQKLLFRKMNSLKLAGGYFSREAFIKLLAFTFNVDNRTTPKRVDKDNLICTEVPGIRLHSHESTTVIQPRKQNIASDRYLR